MNTKKNNEKVTTAKQKYHNEVINNYCTRNNDKPCCQIRGYVPELGIFKRLEITLAILVKIGPVFTIGPPYKDHSKKTFYYVLKLYCDK